MKKIYFILSFFVGISGVILAQNNPLGSSQDTVFEKTIIFKVKPQFKTENIPDLVAPLCASVFENHDYRILPVFPQHSKSLLPLLKNESQTVDLSLIYELFYTDDTPVAEVVNHFSNAVYFEYVQPRYRHYLLYEPNDPSVHNGTQWHHANIASLAAWDITQGDTNVIIGIIDCGTDFTHNDLKTNIAYNYNDVIDGIDNDNDSYIDNFRGWNMAENNNNSQYGSMPHGIFVTGMCSATGDNGTGGAGLALKCKYLPIKAERNGVLLNTYESIVYAADHGCTVVNCSWGSPGERRDNFGQDVVNYATFNKNCIVVAAAGNENNTIPYYPAALDNVISVAATDRNDKKGENGSYHWSVDICAPGASVYSTTSNNGYTTSSGSSFAAPLVSAAAALLKSKYPHLTALQLGEQLKVTADYVAANDSFPYQMGYGRLNVYKALTLMDKPSIILKNSSIEEESNLTYKIMADFQNLLNTANNITIELSCNRNEVTFTDSTLNIATFNNMEIRHSDGDFKFSIPETFPKDSIILFRFDFSGDDYHGWAFFEFIPKSKNLNIVANEVKTTMTSTGNFGYDQNYPRQGLGVQYRERAFLFYGGILFSKSPNTCTDNISNSTGTLNQDFACEILPHAVKDNDTVFIAESVLTEVSSNLNLKVNSKIYAFKNPPLNTSLIYEYTVKNTGTVSHSELYGGIFNDWDLSNHAENRISWDNNAHISYIYPTAGGTHLGVTYFSDYPVRVYAFDNTGTDYSLNIQNGFSDNAKYNALTNNRLQAGQSSRGNNVSLLNAYGPLNLPAGDSVTLVFAVILNENPAALRTVKSALLTAYLKQINPDFEDSIVGITVPVNQEFYLYPNPAGYELTIAGLESGFTQIELRDISGRLIDKPTHLLTESTARIDVSHLSPGIYFMHVQSGNKVQTLKFTIQR